MIIQIVIPHMSGAQRQALQGGVVRLVQGLGFHAEVATFEPSHEALDELAATPAGSASIHVHERLPL